jgi:hypothetical protein
VRHTEKLLIRDENLKSSGMKTGSRSTTPATLRPADPRMPGASNQKTTRRETGRLLPVSRSLRGRGGYVWAEGLVRASKGGLGSASLPLR